MATLSSTEARKAQARKGQENAVASRPICRACGKKSMSAPTKDAMGTVRVCRSCGHEQGHIYGKEFG